MLPFGDLLLEVDGWQYRVEVDEDPDDRTLKFWHCLVDPKGVHHYDEIDGAMGPYKYANTSQVRDIISYIEFQRGRAI